MKCALEIAVEVAEKQRIEAEKEKAFREKRLNEAMEEFKKRLPEIDAFVEKKLIEGNGTAEILVDDVWMYGCDRYFSTFTRKDTYSYPRNKYPYWRNRKENFFFHLDTYIEYLQAHCYKVEIIYNPVRACSSTGKSECVMEGKTLKISIESLPECLK
jgi:hypothetical protein